MSREPLPSSSPRSSSSPSPSPSPNSRATNRLGFLTRNFLSIDPRTLGLLRIGLACLLLFDLAKRVPVLRLFYVNSGLIPNHRMLWRPPREYLFSYLLALSDVREVQIAFALIALVYVCFLIGYRTRLMHVLSWLSLISLHTRADILSSGADFVFGLLLLWSVFLPLGRRFSLDALLLSLRTGSDHGLQSLRAYGDAPRDTAPVVSLAVLALVLQLAVIYFFNTIHKNGETWRDGTAVYWLVHQERIVTWFGYWARESLPLWVFQALAYSTLVVEGMLPLLLLSPWGRPWTRRLAIVCIIGLHAGMALFSNLGVFSPIMMVYALCWVEPRDWELWERWGRRRPGLQLAIDASSGLCFQAARVWKRLDLFGRIELSELPAADGCGWVQTPDGKRSDGEAAIRQLLRVLPFGLLWVLFAQLARPVTGPLARWLARNREDVSRELNLSPAQATQAPPPPTAAFVHLRRLRFWASQVLVLALMFIAVSQILTENPSIPSKLRVTQPRSIRALVGFFRLNQGWSMFAPNAPRSDLWVVVDAVTRDGRHVDPWNELGSRIADPRLRTIPPRLDMDAAYCDYTSRIVGDDVLHDPFREWIFAYHLRTRRPEDRIKHFKAYAIEQDSPQPGEPGPTNVNARVFLRD